MAGIALVTIGLRAAENQCGYQEKWRDRNAIDEDKENQAYNCEYQAKKAYWYRMFLKSSSSQLWFQEYGSHPWTLAQSTCRTDYRWFTNLQGARYGFTGSSDLRD